MKRPNRKRGFTLVELMVVIVIVALMAAIAVPLYTNYIKDARRSEAAGGMAAVATSEHSKDCAIGLLGFAWRLRTT